MQGSCIHICSNIIVFYRNVLSHFFSAHPNEQDDCDFHTGYSSGLNLLNHNEKKEFESTYNLDPCTFSDDEMCFVTLLLINGTLLITLALLLNITLSSLPRG